MTDSKLISTLRIYRGHEYAGLLMRTLTGCEFVFDPLFLQNSRFQGLSFSMPKTKSTYTVEGVNLHAFFAGLLPEGMRLKCILQKLKTSQDDLFTLFATIAPHTVGDVYAKDDSLVMHALELLPKLKQIDFHEYFDKITSINSYAQGEEAFAGVQEKLSASMISFPLNIAKADKSYLLKLNPKDKPHLVENEFFSMKLARLCGIQTATVKIVRDKLGNSGLLVERFDRTNRGGAQVMLHQEDACQVLGLYPSEKYRLSLSDIITGISPFLSAEQASIVKLLRLFCFSYLLGNGDLHAKNISLLTLENNFTDISPAYDLLTTHIYGDFVMAIKLDGRENNIKRSQIVNFSHRLGIKKVVIESMLDEVVKCFSKNYSILKKIPMHEKKWIHLEKTVNKRILEFS